MPEEDHYDPWTERLKVIKDMVLPIVTLLGLALNLWRTESANSKADTAATKATEVAQKTEAIATAADASVKNWKAYNTRAPEDVHEAEKALNKAEANMP